VHLQHKAHTQTYSKSVLPACNRIRLALRHKANRNCRPIWPRCLRRSQPAGRKCGKTRRPRSRRCVGLDHAKNRHPNRSSRAPE